MFKFKTKKIIPYAVVILLLISLSSLIPALKNPSLNILKYPFKVLTLLQREINGLIFYHRNYTQNERLKKQVDFLNNKLNALGEAYLENTRLKNLLSLKQKTSLKVIASLVIGRSPDNWSSIIIIDKGRLYGIKRTMPVITYLGLVGRVIETTEFTSKIILINDPDFSVSCMVKRSRQEGLISGSLGSNLIMRYLPKECDIKPQDIIITSGLTPAYPKGLIIGTVVDIGEEFSGLARYAIVKPAVNLSNLEEVFIIIQ